MTFDLNSLIWTCIVILCILYHRQISNWLYVVKHTFTRDMGGLVLFIKTKLLVRRFRHKDASVGQIFRQVVNRHPNKTAVIWEHGSWTFRELDEFSNRVGNYMKASGFQKGEDIALLMEGRPEYIGFWLGASKAGVVTAFINTNLRHQSLLHSITVVESKALIFTSSMAEQVKEILPQLLAKRPGIQLLLFGSKADAADINLNNNPNHVLNQNGISNNNVTVANNNNDPVGEPKADLSSVRLDTVNESVLSQYSSDMSEHEMIGGFTDKLFYVYTSGTTGLPKAAIIRHARYMFLGTGAHNLVGLKEDSVIYVPIPLYHMAGGAIGTCQLLLFGNTLAVRSKFSASKFWSDCIQWKCTAAQYIGEICRYLLLQPQRPEDTAHNVRVMFGNGLRPCIWREFRTRFNISLIAEFYGATEGNANVVNYTGKEGACGFVSQILPRNIVNMIYPVSIIRVNEETGEPVRNKETGLCIPCGPGETGEFVGKIIKEDPTRSFDGYVNKEATEKKIYRNVFRQGDIVFSSGDLLEVDDLGFVYFKDRTGDTFRWKGENVSTTEVETVIMNKIKLSDVVVYGVPVPGCEGRAGMAAIASSSNLRQEHLMDLFTHFEATLPRYAIPVFIRIAAKIERTATFKLPKVQLQKEGFCPSGVSDQIFFLNQKEQRYSLLDVEQYQSIQSGSIRF